MSATPPATLEGTEAPNPFEVLWDRYKSLIVTVVTAILLALIGNTVWTYMEQDAVSEEWSKFTVSIGLGESYVDVASASDSLSEALKDIELAELESSLAEASDPQKPYFLLAIARKAMMTSNWDRAESALAAIESGYPKHDLVSVTKDAMQTRDPQKLDPDEPTPTEFKWEDPVEGSVVTLMRQQIASAKVFTTPESFAKPEIPADAKKVKITLGDYGSFTIALMPNAPVHVAALIKLLTDSPEWFMGVAVDEVHRSTNTREIPYAMHFGFQSTKDDTRSKWSTTEPSENIIEFEKTGLSHFAGAVSARPEAEGKSCCDRLWISVDDEANLDGSRVVFGYVVEGLEDLRKVCETGLDIQADEQGQGQPTENIRITAVEIL
ncbi:MAG: cyclophilin family peptidyl-prolyl cis-trans isomerase [Planctomycetota bacterium]|jgi:cyclophilin family peptidyl-prolyl cis-trans isomerase